MSFDLHSKVHHNDIPFNLLIKEMSLIVTLMHNAGVPKFVIEQFRANNGKLIGEKMGNDIAERLTGLLPTIRDLPVERKALVHGEVQDVSRKLTPREQTLVQNFIVFCRTKSPFEVWLALLFLWKFGNSYLIPITEFLV